MIIDFHGTINETENCKGVWINTIDIQLTNGNIITLDRDTTYHYVVDGYLFMEWCGVYWWTGTMANYNLCAEMLEGAKIVNVCIEDDADLDYDVTITNMVFSF